MDDGVGNVFLHFSFVSFSVGTVFSKTNIEFPKYDRKGAGGMALQLGTLGGCSSKGPGLDSQDPQDSSHLSLTAVPGNLVAHMYMQVNRDYTLKTNDIIIEKLKKKT